MKLRKQTGAKAVIAAAVAGLFIAALGLIRANPRIEAEAPTQPATAPDYERIFAPQAIPAATDSQPVIRPHTRTRAS